MSDQNPDPRRRPWQVDDNDRTRVEDWARSGGGSLLMFGVIVVIALGCVVYAVTSR